MDWRDTKLVFNQVSAIALISLNYKYDPTRRLVVNADIRPHSTFPRNRRSPKIKYKWTGIVSTPDGGTHRSGGGLSRRGYRGCDEPDLSPSSQTSTVIVIEDPQALRSVIRIAAYHPSKGWGRWDSHPVRLCCKGSGPHPIWGSRSTARSRQTSSTIVVEPALVHRGSSLIDKLDAPGRVTQSLASAPCKFSHRD